MFKFIAEIGINHNGDLGIAKKLINVAKESGCDIVKFQKRTPALCVPEHQKNVMKYNTPWGDITYFDYKKKIEFNEPEYNEIDKYCKELKIDWTASSWDIPSAKFIESYNVKYHKIPSAMLTNTLLLAEIASYSKYTFVSTGMSTIKDIDKAVSIFKSWGCPFELMHTVSTYPMKNEDANLKMIETLRNRYNCKVGWSGHEEGIQISIAAMALGATSVERHITLSRSMWGSDQAASLGVSGLRKLVRDCHIIRKAIGDGVKKILPEEEKKIKSLRGL